MKHITPQKLTIGPITYFKKGSDPQLLIHAGTHGDEWQSIEPIKEYIIKNSDSFSDFIYVPEVSPSAVLRKTRNNINDRDVNRSFFDNSPDHEAVHNLEIINKYDFELCLTFHEDPEYSEFYLYDSGMIKEEIWNNFTDKLSKIEMNTFTGVDDPNDPDLGFSFINGYFSFEHLEPNGSSGSLSDYLLTKKKAKRVLIIEIPSNSTQLQKEQIIELVFQDLVPIL